MNRQARLGFIGLGRMGSARLDTVHRSRIAEVAALCDPEHESLLLARQHDPDAIAFVRVEDLLAADDLELDGVVIASPTGLHTAQARAVLESGLPAFLLRPLGFDVPDVEDLLRTAEARDLALEVEFPYRGLECAGRLRSLVAEGALGTVFHVETRFHNACGPDPEWCLDASLAGGGALLDVGIHLLDLSLWCLGRTGFETGRGWMRDVPGHPGIDGFSHIDVEVDGGIPLRLLASWQAHVGRDCDFGLVVHGSEASAEITNVNGSFHEFELLLREGRRERRVAQDRREWMDRPILDWIGRLGDAPVFDPAVRSNLALARLLGQVYRPREGTRWDVSDGTAPMIASQAG
jgi:predicted dehydrogenase